MTSFLEKVIEENEWKALLKSIVPECNKRVNDKLAAVQKKMEAAPFNVKKDQCNVKFNAIIACTEIEAFVVNQRTLTERFQTFNINFQFQKCPASMWTEGKNCAEGKKWATECGKNIDSKMELIMMLKKP